MNLYENVDESWIPFLQSLTYQTPLVQHLAGLKEVSYQPLPEQIFRVFGMPVKDIKMVMLGSDPYPIPGMATGYAYAVSETSAMPTTLRNLEKEIYTTEGIRVLNDDNDIVDQSWKTLEHLTKQGIFLLNSALTVETGAAGSHMEYWKAFTDAVVSYISSQNPCVWMLLGKNALSYAGKIKNPLVVRGYDRETIQDIPVDPKTNYIIPGFHPLMTGLSGEAVKTDNFYHANVILEKRSLSKIIW